tara:strand:- start:346 stop:651 length:306 start_codon:yes stop_codon:yes gene_type:complete
MPVRVGELNVYCHDQFGQSVFCINPNYELRLSAFTTPNTNVTITLDSPNQTLVNEEITTNEHGSYMYVNYTLGETLQHGIYKLKAVTTNETDVKEYTYPNE